MVGGFNYPLKTIVRFLASSYPRLLISSLSDTLVYQAHQERGKSRTMEIQMQLPQDTRYTATF